MDRETAVPRVDSMPGEKAREWVAYHHEHAAPSTYVYDFVWDITADATARSVPTRTATSSWISRATSRPPPLGYNNPKMLDRAGEFDLVDPLKIAGQDFYVSTGGAPDETPLPGPAT